MMRPGVLLLLLVVVACGRGTPRVVPAYGNAIGGEQVRVEAQDLASHGAPVVYFGDRAARAVVVESDELIVVRTPEAEQAGPVAVTARFSDGTVLEIPSTFEFQERWPAVRLRRS